MARLTEFIRRSALLLATLLSLCSTPEVRATCGSSYCFLDVGPREGVLPAGSFRLDLAYQYINQNRWLSGSQSVGEVLTPKIDFADQTIEQDHHREFVTRNTLINMSMSWGIIDRLSLVTFLPLVNDRDHEHDDDVGTPDESFSSTDGGSGFGDIRIGVRHALLVKPRDLLLGDLDLKLPTGSYDQRDSEGEVNEPGIQPGSGSTDIIGRIRWTHRWPSDTRGLFMSLAYRLNGDNDYGYRFGDETVFNAGHDQSFNVRWSWTIQLNARHTRRDEYLGGGVPSTGSDLVNLSPGMRFLADSGMSYYFFYQYPVYQNVNEAQLAPRGGILIGLSKVF